MPDTATIRRAQKDRREGKSASTQAGEFVKEEMHHIREGKHGARSARQAVAIGLSKARRAGVKLAAPEKGKAPDKTRRSAARELDRGSHPAGKPSKNRSQATQHALEREGRSAASHQALSKQAHAAARKRSAADRQAAAQKAVRTKGHAGLARAARKAAKTRTAKAAGR